MKAIFLLISVLVVSTHTHAQDAQAPEPAPGIQIVKYGWSKERLNWQRDPFRPTIEDSIDARNRVTAERRRGTALEERQGRDQKADKEKPTEPPRYVFSYKLTLVNAGPRAIKEIDWDYIFSDAATGEQLGRREFTSVEKIGPGKRKELSVLISAPPTQRVSVYSLGKRERDGLSESVIVLRILYDDNTVWQALSK